MWRRWKLLRPQPRAPPRSGWQLPAPPEHKTLPKMRRRLRVPTKLTSQSTLTTEKLLLFVCLLFSLPCSPSVFLPFALFSQHLNQQTSADSSRSVATWVGLAQRLQLLGPEHVQDGNGI